jgi:hypothetical protein
VTFVVSLLDFPIHSTNGPNSAAGEGGMSSDKCALASQMKTCFYSASGKTCSMKILAFIKKCSSKQPVSLKLTGKLK